MTPQSCWLGDRVLLFAYECRRLASLHLLLLWPSLVCNPTLANATNCRVFCTTSTEHKFSSSGVLPQKHFSRWARLGLMELRHFHYFTWHFDAVTSADHSWTYLFCLRKTLACIAIGCSSFDDGWIIIVHSTWEERQSLPLINFIHLSVNFTFLCFIWIGNRLSSRDDCCALKLIEALSSHIPQKK